MAVGFDPCLVNAAGHFDLGVATRLAWCRVMNAGSSGTPLRDETLPERMEGEVSEPVESELMNQKASTHPSRAIGKRTTIGTDGTMLGRYLERRGVQLNLHVQQDCDRKPNSNLYTLAT